MPRALSTALALLVASIPITAVAGPWQGKVTKADGVTTVENPAAPMQDPVTIQPERLWEIGGDSDADEEFFGVINRILVDDDGNVYLLDNQLNEVKVFSADGEYLRTLGREGEGPGEFRNPMDMCFLPDGTLGVMQLAPGRIVKLTLEGEPAGEHPLPPQEGGSPLILIGGARMGDNLLLIANRNKMGEGKIDIVRYAAVIGPDGSQIAELLTSTRTIEFANAVLEEKDWSTFDRRWQVGPNGSFYACPTFADYEVDIWGPDGTKKMVITRPYTHWDRPQREKDRVKGIFESFTRQIPNAQIKVSDFDQDIANIYPRSDGTLWVLTSHGTRERPDGVLGIFDVFNADGQYVREVTVKGDGNPLTDGIFFEGNRLFVVTGFLDAALAAQGGGSADDDLGDAEPMAVICYQLDASKAGM